jgi:hypothetical protein
MPLRVCLLVPTHTVWTSELVLPNWLNAEQERVEVLLFVQASCDSEQAMSVDAVFNENAAVEKDMHLLQVHAIKPPNYKIYGAHVAPLILVRVGVGNGWLPPQRLQLLAS